MKECCRYKIGKCASEANPQPNENFAKDVKRKDGLTPQCKSCLKKYRDENKTQRSETIKKWRDRNPEKVREYNLKDAPRNRERVRKWRLKNPDYRFLREYGITQNDFENLFENQNGKCAICKIDHSELPKRLHVDHCHATGKVRWLLCSICNQALGMFKDDTSLLDRAKEYLTK